MSSTRLIGNTFIVGDNESYIVYSPFSGKITRVHSFPENGSKIFESLRSLGFFENIPKTTLMDDVDTWGGFRSLTLLLTRRCNLACVYCYATARTFGRTMNRDLALGALNWFSEQFKGNTIRVSFHGGGEPTLEHVLIKEVVSRTYHLAEESGKKTRFQIVTNGTADTSLMEWFIKNNFGISISSDGPASIQNRNRPFANGNESSRVVENTIRYLVANNYPFTVRLTFSPTDNIEEIVSHFGGLGVKSLHIEPLFPHGREYKKKFFEVKGKNELYSLNGIDFVKSFLKAMEVAQRYGIKITNSHLGHFTKGLGYFCGSASGRSMIVTDDGFISGCLEVVDAKDQNFGIFQLGKFHSEQNTFVVDKNVLARFQVRHSDILSHCKKCFARYVCSGGCAVKAVRASGKFMDRDIPYCIFTKALIPAIVEKIARLSGV